MNKFFFLAALFISQWASSQYCRFKINFKDAVINGKHIQFFNPMTMLDMNDSTDFNIYGFNNDNERLGVKYFLIKISTTEGVIYLPYVQIIYVPPSGFIRDIPAPHPVYSDMLSKNNQLIKRDSLHMVDSSGNNHFEVFYNYVIDGTHLKYDEVKNPKSNFANLELNLKNLALEDSTIIKNKKIILKESSTFQRKEIGRYLKHPVYLNYRVLTGKLGEQECMILVSSLQFTNKKGESDSVEFIKTTSLVKQSPSYKNTNCEPKGQPCRNIIGCDYDILFFKKE